MDSRSSAVPGERLPRRVSFGARRSAGPSFGLGIYNLLGFRTSLAIMCVAAVVLIVAGAGLATHGSWPLAIVFVVLGLLAPVLVWRMRPPARRLVLDHEGLLDEGIVGLGRVGWDRVVNAVPGLAPAAPAVDGVVVTLHDPAGDFARLPGLRRVDGSSNTIVPPRVAGVQAFFPATELGADPSDVARRMEAYRSAWQARSAIRPRD